MQYECATSAAAAALCLVMRNRAQAAACLWRISLGARQDVRHLLRRQVRAVQVLLLLGQAAEQHLRQQRSSRSSTSDRLKPSYTKQIRSYGSLACVAAILRPAKQRPYLRCLR